MTSVERIKELLTLVIDPELAINIIDLGLVYTISVEEEVATIVMTLTSPACPFVDLIEEQIESILAQEGWEVIIQFTFDPPWSLDMISPVIRAERGL